jgi:putative ABC transport system ATP-binding protein
MPPPQITLEVVQKIYKMGEIDVLALQEVSLKIAKGEFLIIVGPSGSGKSTLLNLIGGMERPTSGKVLFENQDLSQASDSQLTLYRRYQVGFVFQFYNLIPTLTALENVEVATEIARHPRDPLECLKLVGLAHRAHHFPSQLSGGEQQRVSIARALSGSPALLLCDEPTGALDIQTGKQVLQLLKTLNQELQMTVVLITHNHAITAIGDRQASIRDGRIVQDIPNEHPLSVEELQW